jgi:Ribbon-helix-helix protein, copG family
MHRTQIYLGESLHSKLKARSRTEGVSLSEVIRRALEKHVESDPLAEAEAFFSRLQPLESMAEVSAESYVRSLRSTSRLLRDTGSAEPK